MSDRVHQAAVTGHVQPINAMIVLDPLPDQAAGVLAEFIVTQVHMDQGLVYSEGSGPGLTDRLVHR
jgi:hypothetical protein